MERCRQEEIERQQRLSQEYLTEELPNHNRFRYTNTNTQQEMYRASTASDLYVDANLFNRSKAK